MNVSFCVNMWCLLVLCPVLLATGAQTLTIDSHLGTSIEDCFDRISIGEQLPPSAIYRNVSELTTRECEHICKQDKQCQTYAYGVGAKGNATCDLSNMDERELREKRLLLKDPDYDVFVRRLQCEQSPPTPLQPLMDEPFENKHRPVYRPNNDESDRPRPIMDEYPASFEYGQDIRPNGPLYMNYIDRPDNFYNQIPDFDGPSYGLHKPQDIPFRPDRPNYGQRPQNLPLRPDRPPSYVGHRPQELPLRPDHPPDLPLGPDRPPSYGLHKPQELPFRPDIPDRPPSYGAHKPQEIPFKPEISDMPPTYGLHKPQEIPYKPERPQHNRPYQNTTKPDPYDELYFQNGIARPPGNWRPDPYQPLPPDDNILDLYGQRPMRPQSDLPPFRPQYSQYNRPIRRPMPAGYGHGYPPLQYYPGPYDIPNRPYHPNRPMYPYIPQNILMHDYQGQYASNFGQSQYDYPMYLQMYDSPYRPPYRPPRPENDRPVYGENYGYGGSPNSDHNTYGEGTMTQLDNNNRPRPPVDQLQDIKPSRPSYETPTVTYGGLTDPVKKPEKPSDNSAGYGTQKPEKPLQSPSYGSQNPQPSNTASQAPEFGYGIPQKPQDFQGYGSHLGYGTQGLFSSNYGGFNQEQVNRPLGDRPYKPSFSERPLYGERPQYNKPTDSRPIYGEQSPIENTPSYGNRPFNDRPSNNKPSYGSTSNINRPHRPSYEESYNKPSNDGASNKPTYNEPSYNRPSVDDVNNRPDDPGSYGAEVEDTGYKNSQRKPNRTSSNKRPNVKPVYEYEIEKPVGAPSYFLGPGGEVITSRPVTISSGGHGREPVNYKGVLEEIFVGNKYYLCTVSFVFTVLCLIFVYMNCLKNK